VPPRSKGFDHIISIWSLALDLSVGVPGYPGTVAVMIGTEITVGPSPTTLTAETANL